MTKISEETNEAIAAARHECAQSGPCSVSHDGCACSDSDLIVRAFRRNLALARAAVGLAPTALPTIKEPTDGK
jgi:hypothetical protein